VYVDRLIAEDIRNNSAWSQRLTGFTPDVPILIHSYKTKYRMNLLEPDEIVNHVQDNDDALLEDELAEPIYEFDQLLNEQITISKNLYRDQQNITGISRAEPMVHE
jgi:hypothetical protein